MECRQTDSQLFSFIGMHTDAYILSFDAFVSTACTADQAAFTLLLTVYIRTFWASRMHQVIFASQHDTPS